MALDQFEKSVWVSRAITASSSVGITHTWSQVAIRGFYKWRSFSLPSPSPHQVLPSLHRWSDYPLCCRWGPKEQVSLIQESCEFGQKSGGCSVVQLSMSSTQALVRSIIHIPLSFRVFLLTKDFCAFYPRLLSDSPGEDNCIDTTQGNQVGSNRPGGNENLYKILQEDIVLILVKQILTLQLCSRTCQLLKPPQHHLLRIGPQAPWFAKARLNLFKFALVLWVWGASNAKEARLFSTLSQNLLLLHTQPGGHVGHDGGVEVAGPDPHHQTLPGGKSHAGVLWNASFRRSNTAAGSKVTGYNLSVCVRSRQRNVLHLESLLVAHPRGHFVDHIFMAQTVEAVSGKLGLRMSDPLSPVTNSDFTLTPNLSDVDQILDQISDFTKQICNQVSIVSDSWIYD